MESFFQFDWKAKFRCLLYSTGTTIQRMRLFLLFTWFHKNWGTTLEQFLKIIDQKFHSVVEWIDNLNRRLPKEE